MSKQPQITGKCRIRFSHLATSSYRYTCLNWATLSFAAFTTRDLKACSSLNMRFAKVLLTVPFSQELPQQPKEEPRVEKGFELRCWRWPQLLMISNGVEHPPFPLPDGIF